MSKRKPNRPGRAARRQDATQERRHERRETKRRKYVRDEGVAWIRERLGQPEMPYAEAEETLRLNPPLYNEWLAEVKAEQEAKGQEAGQG